MSLFLSRLTLNPSNAGARRDLSTPYELHRTLMRGVDGRSDGGRLLFRLEPEPGPGGPLVLVQTQVLPDWSQLLQNQYLLRLEGPKGFDLHVSSGQVLRFGLVAHPGNRIGGRRTPLLRDVRGHEHEKTYWDGLCRRAAVAGFEVLDATDVQTRFASRRGGDDTKRAIPHFGVRFDGLLRVVDEEGVYDAVCRGIGPAKAFGFGLLSLAPA